MRLMAVLALGALVLTVSGATEAAPKKGPKPVSEKKPVPEQGTVEFDKTAAVQALGGVDLSKCKTTNAARGDGHIFITFAAAGGVSKAEMDKGPMMGTPVQKCIEKAYKKAKVPAFKGDPVQVGKNFKFD